MLWGISFPQVAIFSFTCVILLVQTETLSNRTMQASALLDVHANQHSNTSRSCSPIIITQCMLDAHHLNFCSRIKTLEQQQPADTKTKMHAVLRTTITVYEADFPGLAPIAARRLSIFVVADCLFGYRDTGSFIFFIKHSVDAITASLCNEHNNADLAMPTHFTPSITNSHSRGSPKGVSTSPYLHPSKSKAGTGSYSHALFNAKKCAPKIFLQAAHAAPRDSSTSQVFCDCSVVDHLSDSFAAAALFGLFSAVQIENLSLFGIILITGCLVINVLFGAFAPSSFHKRRSVSVTCPQPFILRFIRGSSSFIHKLLIACFVATGFLHVANDWFVKYRAMLRFPSQVNSTILMLVLFVFASPVSFANHCEKMALANDRSELAAASLPSGLVFFAGGFTGSTILLLWRLRRARLCCCGVTTTC